MQQDGTQGAGREMSRMSGRWSVDRLPPAMREAVAAAIEEGATIDEITARIRALGSNCSRSAVGRYVKRVRGMIRLQNDMYRFAETWMRGRGDRAESRSGLVAIEALRSMALLSVADLNEDGQTATTEEVARLALALQRIEGADRRRAERERAAAPHTDGAQHRTDGAGRKLGLSPETVAAIRLAVEGRPRS